MNNKRKLSGLTTSHIKDNREVPTERKKKKMQTEKKMQIVDTDELYQHNKSCRIQMIDG